MNKNAREKGLCQAFTLAELLALLAVVAMLFSLQLTGMARATRETKIAQCAVNLRQFALATILYAHDNQNRLPAVPANFWAWDIPGNVTDHFARYGVHWKTFYCPGTAPRFSDEQNSVLYHFAPAYRVLGYATTYHGTTTLEATNWNSTLTPPSVQVGFGTYHTELASQRVLLADVTMSAPGQNNPGLFQMYNFSAIQGGFPTPFGSAHLTGRLPLGGNLAMLDGHVEWRDFQLMYPRTSGPSPVFWW